MLSDVATDARMRGESRRERHGMSETPEYSSWAMMWSRVRGSASNGKRFYTDRGVTVCDRWRSFLAFFADMGKRPPGTTLDRKDGTRGYSPDNCKWSTPTEQARNTRRNRRLTHAGETLTVAEWAERTGLSGKTLHTRLRLGWPVDRVLTTPPGPSWKNGGYRCH